MGKTGPDVPNNWARSGAFTFVARSHTSASEQHPASASVPRSAIVYCEAVRFLPAARRVHLVVGLSGKVMHRSMTIFLPLVGLFLSGCVDARMVGNPKTGFIIQFSDKWQGAGDVKPVPDFVQQANRYQCPFDRCGRHALGTGLYGRLPDDMRVAGASLPHADDVAALLDLMLYLRGNLRERHLRRAAVGTTTGYRMRLVLPNAQGMRTVVHGAIVFHASRFLFLSVSAPIADDDVAERMLNELADDVKVPQNAGV